MTNKYDTGMPSIVLVHGGFVDGSGWEAVFGLLRIDGYRVHVVQNPATSLTEDVEVTRRALAGIPGPVILVGHSYGGAVITVAGNDPKVVALVYIAAFVPDQGESVGSLTKDPAPGVHAVPIVFAGEGFLGLDPVKFQSAFAADVAPAKAEFMAASQVAWGMAAMNGIAPAAAWRTKPSWYLVTTLDQMIPPAAQHAMAKRAGATVGEIEASHSAYISRPTEVAAFIMKAATSLAGHAPQKEQAPA